MTEQIAPPDRQQLGGFWNALPRIKASDFSRFSAPQCWRQVSSTVSTEIKQIWQANKWQN